MTKKLDRQRTIVELIGAHAIGSQEELRQLLATRGWVVTQATLSRDLHELGMVRAATGGGARYLLPAMVADDSKPALDMLLPELFSRLDGVAELIVLHTLAGGAQPIAEAIDSQGWTEIMGTLAGENTVLIICRSVAARTEVSERLIDLSRSA